MHAASVRIETADAPDEPAPFSRPATITTVLGEGLTGGFAVVARTAGGWTAVLSRLERPGVLASMFFGQGLREVVLRLDDGRHARARIAGTSFVAAAERVCHLEGLEPLA